MPSIPIEKNCYYHILNRGNQKQQLFFDERDYARMLFLILHFQSPITLDKPSRQIDHFLKHGTFNVDNETIQKIIATRRVDLINFCIMPNHFHLTLRNKTRDGIPLYMQRVSNAIGKYFNIKYEKTGHVFQGTYKAVYISDDNQLSYLSAYIHKNPKELLAWKKKENKYPWSSFCDYRNNRWGQLLLPGMILNRFRDFSAYAEFVKKSVAKEI